MALGLRRKGPRGSVGLDLDGDHIAAVEIVDGRLARAISAQLEPGLIEEGEVRDGAGLSEALRRFFSANGLPQRVRLGVANQQISVRPLEIPPIEDPKERRAAVQFMAADTIAMPLDDAVLDYQAVGDVEGSDGSRRERVVVVAARRTMIETLARCVQNAGLEPESIDLDAFAVVRVLASAGSDESGATVYCHLGDVVNLAIAVGSTCVFTRPLSPVREESGLPRVAALAEDIRLSIDFFMVQDGATPVSRVVLSGPDARNEGLVEELTEAIELPVERAEPLANLDSAELPDGEDPYRHTVAAGLALGATA
jgi:type IV pilus assembly protein PilM